MFLSNKLLWALRDHAQMSSPFLADLALEVDLESLEQSRNSPDKFDRPCPIKVKVDLQTGEIQ